MDNLLLEEDKKKILAERERSEKESGKYNLVSKLRAMRDQANVDFNKAKEDPDYEKKLEKYEKRCLRFPWPSLSISPSHHWRRTMEKIRRG